MCGAYEFADFSLFPHLESPWFAKTAEGTKVAFIFPVRSLSKANGKALRTLNVNCTLAL